MFYRVLLCVLMCASFLGWAAWVGATESDASPPSILSTDLSSVNYLQKASQEWTVIIADQEAVTHVWIDGQPQTISPKKTVVLKKNLRFEKGKNTFKVEAQNRQGVKAQRTFTVYYEEDLEKLTAHKTANLPPEEQPFATFVTAGVGLRQESNAAHFSNNVVPRPTFDDRQATIQSGQLSLGYRVKPKDTSRTFQLQYAYFSENYEDKKVAGAELSDLGLHAHTVSAQYTWTQPQQAWSLIYAFSRFNGNAKTAEADRSTADNGHVASFHFLVPTFTRIHNETFSSMVLLKLISRNFHEEPKDTNQDRDSALSTGVDYNIFYYLPNKSGRFKGLLGYYTDNAEGKSQRFSQQNFAVDYSRSWQMSQWHSEIQWQLGTQGRLTTYREKYALRVAGVDEPPKPEKRRTLRQTDQTTLSWIYQSSLTLQAGYSHIRDFSSIDEFTFKNEVRSLNLSWHSFF